MQSVNYETLDLSHTLDRLQYLRKECKQLEISISTEKSIIDEQRRQNKMLSEKLSVLPWELQRAEFAQFYEDLEIEYIKKQIERNQQFLETIKDSNMEIDQSSINNNIVKKKKLEEEIKSLQSRLVELKSEAEICYKTLNDTHIFIQVLKNRNNAIMKKMLKHKQEIEAKALKLTQRLQEYNQPAVFQNLT